MDSKISTQIQHPVQKSKTVVALIILTLLLSTASLMLFSVYLKAQNNNDTLNGNLKRTRQELNEAKRTIEKNNSLYKEQLQLIADQSNNPEKYRHENTSGTDTYINSKYNYELKYPKDWLAVSEEKLIESGRVNFRSIDDQIPAESGFTIIVIENPQNLSVIDMCTDPKHSNTVLCTPKTLKTTDVVINQITWEKIENDSAGFVPAGTVYYAITHNKNMYLVIKYGFKEVIDDALQTFRFLDLFAS